MIGGVGVAIANALDRASNSCNPPKSFRDIAGISARAIPGAVLEHFLPGPPIPFLKGPKPPRLGSGPRGGGAGAGNGGGGRQGGAGPVRTGQAGENAVTAQFDIGPKTPININGRSRIPDGLNDTTLTEVKNVQDLAFTQQLRDFADFAGANELQFDLFVRGGAPGTRTNLSGPLQTAVDNGTINLRFIP